MCGIVGAVGGPERDLRRGLTRASASLRHRGPDDSDARVFPEHLLGLACRRLSIIDLSPAGRQPLGDETGKVWIVFNGEIYNYGDLRSELRDAGRRFSSKSDSEVVLQAYLAWGMDHVRRLNGMFAYGIADLRGRPPGAPPRLFLVRDRLGIKPLHYAWAGGRFIFASEIKAVLSFPWVTPDVDMAAISDFLTLRYVPAPRTAYAAVRKVQPATIMTLDGGALREERYWEPDIERRVGVSAHEAARQTRGLLEQAVTSHMVSDVPVGALLSGGVDSSSVTALMSSGGGGPLATFTIGFDVPGSDERGFARIVSERYGTAHHERVMRAGAMKATLRSIVDAHDEPFADSSAIPMQALAALASRHVKVALSGDGGDEVFGGYGRYETWIRRNPWVNARLGPLRPVARTLSRMAPTDRGRRLLSYLAHDVVGRYGRMLSLHTSDEKERIAGPLLAPYVGPAYDDYWSLRPHWRPADPLTQVQYLDLMTYLPDDINTKVDRASMAHSLEVRPPLLDHRLVEYVLSLPGDTRMGEREQKALFRSSVGELIPTEVLTRPKHGFEAPVQTWLEREGEWARDFIAEGELIRQGVLSTGVFRLPGRGKFPARMWGLLVLEEWFRRLVS